MSSWSRDVRLVAGREITDRFRGRALWVVTGLAALLAVVLVVLPTLLSSKQTRVGLVGNNSVALSAQLVASAKASGLTITTTSITSGQSAESMLQGRQHSLDVVIEDQGSGYRVVTDTGTASNVEAVINTTIKVDHVEGVLRAASVPPATVSRALTPPAVAYDTLQPQPPGQAGRALAAIAAAFLLMYGVAGWGAAVASGVAQEKTTRMAEILVSAVPTTRLITGKVAGIGLCGLFQVVVTVGAAVVTNTVVHAADIPSTFWDLVPTALLWFVLGFVGYSFAFAAAGSLVARQEEVQMVQTPLVIPLVVALLLSYVSTVETNTAWYRVISVLPPFAPILMPARVAAGSVSAWEFVLAVVLMLAAIAAVVWMAVRIYAGSIVRGGPRLGLRTALRHR